MLNIMKRLVIENDGQGMTEYALVLGVIALGAIALITAFNKQVVDLWTAVTTKIEGAVTTVTATTP